MKSRNPTRFRFYLAIRCYRVLWLTSRERERERDRERNSFKDSCLHAIFRFASANQTTSLCENRTCRATCREYRFATHSASKRSTTLQTVRFTTAGNAIRKQRSPNSAAPQDSATWCGFHESHRGRRASARWFRACTLQRFFNGRKSASARSTPRPKFISRAQRAADAPAAPFRSHRRSRRDLALLRYRSRDVALT